MEGRLLAAGALLRLYKELLAMKKIISLLLSAALLLALLSACQEPAPSVSSAPAKDWAVNELASLAFDYSGREDQDGLESVHAETDREWITTYLENAYGLQEPWVDAAMIRATGASAFEIAVLRMEDEGAAVRAATAFMNYISARQGDFTGYAPAEADMAANGEILQEGPYAALFICPDPKQASAAVEAAILDNTKAIFIETLGNPNSDVVDIEAIAAIAHAHHIPLVVDNTFATPYLVRPIDYGADIVVHSATKFIGGHGTTLGGVIVDSGRFDWEASGRFPSLTEPNPSYHGVVFTKAAGQAAFVTKIRAILLRDMGACLSPFHAFFFLQGLETLSLRVERHVQNALQVVKYLKDHPQVEAVHHPSVSEEESQQALYKKYFPHGGGSIFTFEIKGGAQKAKEFIDNLELFSLLANVADVKSLVIHPATTTHSQCTEEELLEQDIKPNTIRLSIGIENAEDLIAALETAFEVVKE